MTNDFAERLTRLAAESGADLKRTGSRFTFERVVAERKVMLSKKKLTYTAKIDVDDDSRTITMSELLKETGSGLGSGAGDNAPGFGFKTETYRSGGTRRSGTISEQSSLFGAKYDYQFDFAEIRTRIESMARDAGYRFEHRL